MQILCDHHVPAKYISAFEDAAGITVRPVSDVLSPTATDHEIARYAEQNDWVVFTNDDDFLLTDGDHGLLIYDQIADPPPGNIVDAVNRIDDAYESNEGILEAVPGEWI